MDGPRTSRQGFRLTGRSWLSGYHPQGTAEEQNVAAVRALLAAHPDPYDRTLELHLTGSAIVLDPGERRVLFRWHERQGDWLQVGGHGDPGESDPVGVALREALEESGLPDLSPWPDADSPTIVHVVIVPVPALSSARAEPAHEHADIRYLFTTSRPELARAENEQAQLRWVPLREAIEIARPNLAETLRRVDRLI